MRAAQVTVGPVYTIADAVDDAHFREREIIVEADDAEARQPADAQHRAAAVAHARRMAAAGARARRAHRRDPAEAGLDAEAIARLRKEGGAA